MADITFRTTRALVSSTNTTQDITISGIGTPKGVIAIVNNATADDTITDGLIHSYGFFDGTNYRCYSTFDEDNVATTNTGSELSESVLVTYADDYSASTRTATAAFITDGIRLTWAGTSTTQYYITLLFIGGADVTPHVGSYTANATAGVASVTGLGYRPEMMFSAANALEGVGTVAGSSLSTGFASSLNGVISEGCTQYISLDAKTTTDNQSSVENQFISARHGGFFFSKVKHSIVSFDSDGFTYDKAFSGQSGSPYVSYLALEFPNGIPTFEAFTQNQSNTTGSQIVAPSTLETPEFSWVMFGGSTILGTAKASVMHSHVWADGTNTYSSSLGAYDNQATSVTSANSVSGKLSAIDLTATVLDFEADTVALVSGGLQANVTTASDRETIGFNFNKTPNYILSADSGSYTITGTQVSWQGGAALKYGVARGVTAFSGNSVDYTIEAFNTPKAAIVIYQNAPTDDTLDAGASYGYTLFDGTDAIGASFATRDGVTTSNEVSYYSNDETFGVYSSTNQSTLNVRGNLEFIDHGLRINWTTNTSLDGLVTVILFGGSGIQAKTIEDNQTSAGDTAVTGVGFQPNIAFFISQSRTGNGSSSTTRFSTGLAVQPNGGAISQGATLVEAIDNQNPSDINTTSSLSNCIITYDGATESYSNLKSFDADGLTVNTPDSVTYKFGALALDIGTSLSPIFVSGNLSNTTGSQDILPVAEEGFSFYHLQDMAAYDTPQANGTLSTIATAGTNFANTSIGAADNVSPTEANAFASSTRMGIVDPTSAALSFEATGVTVTSTGINGNVTNASDAAYYGFYLGQNIMPADSGSYTVTGTATGLLKTFLDTAGSGSYNLSGTDVNFLAGKTMSAENGAYTVTGIDVTLALGRIMPIDSGTYTLTGTATNLEYHRVESVTSGSYTLTGTAAGLLYNKALDAANGSFTLTGTNVDIRLANKVIADNGAFNLTGTNIDVLATRLTTVDSGTYTYTGTSLNLLKGYPLPVDSGVYVETGTASNLLVQRKLVVDSGTITLTGTGINFQGNQSIQADTGSVALTGSTINLLTSRVTTADSGSYNLSGTDITLDRGFTVSLDNGSYSLTGTDITLDFTRSLITDSGTINLAGTDIGLSFTKTMVADNGSITLTGTDVSLVYSGAPLVTASGERLVGVDLENRVITILTS